MENLAPASDYCARAPHVRYFTFDQVKKQMYTVNKPHRESGYIASVKYELPTIASVWVGFWNYDQGKPTTPDHYDVWVDEFALDSQRIGCDL